MFIFLSSFKIALVISASFISIHTPYASDILIVNCGDFLLPWFPCDELVVNKEPENRMDKGFSAHNIGFHPMHLKGIDIFFQIMYVKFH